MADCTAHWAHQNRAAAAAAAATAQRPGAPPAAPPGRSRAAASCRPAADHQPSDLVPKQLGTRQLGIYTMLYMSARWGAAATPAAAPGAPAAGRGRARGPRAPAPPPPPAPARTLPATPGSSACIAMHQHFSRIRTYSLVSRAIAPGAEVLLRQSEGAHSCGVVLARAASLWRLGGRRRPVGAARGAGVQPKGAAMAGRRAPELRRAGRGRHARILRHLRRPRVPPALNIYKQTFMGSFVDTGQLTPSSSVEMC
jgi:hypothetical protein